MSKKITFTLNGEKTEALEGETLLSVAQREGIEIPHMCHSGALDYRSDGNCRSCMVEIEGERVLAASCIRKVQQDMVIKTHSARAEKARSAVFELWLSDQPERDKAHHPFSRFWQWIDHIGLKESRFPKNHDALPPADRSHKAMAVNLDACIHCTLCVRACQEVQSNDVIGMSGRGHQVKIIFDFDDPMGLSSCVACGECVQACPTGALMPASRVDDRQIFKGKEEKKIQSLCPYCGVGCQTIFHVKDNKIIQSDGRSGPANRNRLCVKGRFGIDYASHPHRLTVPLIRKEGVEKSWDQSVDPGNPFSHFREATWEEALKKASSGLKRIRDNHGVSTLAGFGSAKGSNEEAYLFQKLIRTGFGTNNVDHCTRLCHASSVEALMEGVGSGAVTSPFMTAEDADCIIVIGARPTENHPVAATFFKNAAKSGTKLILLDPRKQDLSRHAFRHLQFKAGCDVSLLNAMIHTIIEEKLFDQQYVQTRTNNFEKICDNIREFAPEKMAAICGIDAETIRDTARIYARSEKSIIFWGMGISQHVHGTDNSRCLITLASICGHIGRKGTGLHPLRGQNNVQGASDAGLIPKVFPDYQPVMKETVRKKFENFWNTPLNPDAGLTVVEIINAIAEDKIKGLYVMGENPAMSDPDTRHVREALSRLEMLVVQEIFLTETAFHADVVLPASAFPEKNGTFTNTNRQVQMARQALSLPGKARQDWEIIQDIARGMGLDWNYQNISEVFEEMRQAMPSIKGISWKRLEVEDSVTYPCNDEKSAGQEILFAETFPTESGRVNLVPTQIVPPAELPDDDYPYILTTGRLLEHWHTGAMTRRAAILNHIEPEPSAHLHPGELKKIGVAPGDQISVTTRRGTITLKARADRQVAKGMVFIPFCFHESPANILTNPQLDPYGKIPEFKFCAAKIITDADHTKKLRDDLQKIPGE